MGRISLPRPPAAAPGSSVPIPNIAKPLYMVLKRIGCGPRIIVVTDAGVYEAPPDAPAFMVRVPETARKKYRIGIVIEVTDTKPRCQPIAGFVTVPVMEEVV